MYSASRQVGGQWKRSRELTVLGEPKDNHSKANDEGENETNSFKQNISNHVFSLAFQSG